MGADDSLHGVDRIAGVSDRALDFLILNEVVMLGRAKAFLSFFCLGEEYRI